MEKEVEILSALQECERTYHRMMLEGTRDNIQSYEQARARFWKLWETR